MIFLDRRERLTVGRRSPALRSGPLDPPDEFGIFPFGGSARMPLKIQDIGHAAVSKKIGVTIAPIELWQEVRS